MAKAMTRSTRPMSPCMSICTLDEANICMGCLRTLAEIKSWATLSGSEQWTLLGELEERQAGRKATEY
jgi:predicted Fe-S protein YdhL (DUF1289 family)